MKTLTTSERAAIRAGRGTGRLKNMPPMARLVVAVTAAQYNVKISDLTYRTRGLARFALARHVAMYLMNVVLGMTFTDIGTCFRRDRTSISHACARIEDLRDDPQFDAELSQMEGLVGIVASSRDPRQSQEETT